MRILVWESVLVICMGKEKKVVLGPEACVGKVYIRWGSGDQFENAGIFWIRMNAFMGV